MMRLRSFLLSILLNTISLTAYLPRSLCLAFSKLAANILSTLPIPPVERNLNVITNHLIAQNRMHLLRTKVGRKQIKRLSYYYLLKNSCDFLRFIVLGRTGLDELIVNPQELKKIQSAYMENQGLIGICMHLGNWELGAPLLDGLDIDLSSLVFRQIDPAMERFIQKARKRNRVKLLHQRNGLRQAVKNLQNHEMVTVLCDQDGTRAGYFQDFFGLSCSYPRVFELFCSKSDPKLQAMVLLHEGDKYQIKVFDPIESAMVRDRQDEFYSYLRDWHEEMILSHPEQWLLVYDRFKFRHDSLLKEQGSYAKVRKEYEIAWKKPVLE